MRRTKRMNLTWLKYLRLLCGKSQGEVAEALGISRVYLARIESMHEPIRQEIAIKLGELYGVAPADIYRVEVPDYRKKEM